MQVYCITQLYRYLFEGKEKYRAMKANCERIVVAIQAIRRLKITYTYILHIKSIRSKSIIVKSINRRTYKRKAN
ncbi:hypothetical protein CJF30_00011353 [Rutstroemia sp. NJR-2017a BBW]|nr:hypothetical protein CJF30_00011353 [Rutstroemia sp. NJR-2017a BBW]